MQEKPTMLVVAVALIDSGERVLLQQRPAGREMAGLWEFPGGKIEPGEQPEHALVREIEEELGILIAPERLEAACFASASLGAKHLLLLLYLCRTWSGTPQALEASALRWVRPDRMAELPMPPADIPLVRLLQKVLN